MAQDDQDGSDANPSHSPELFPLSEHALNSIGAIFPTDTGPHPAPDADAVIPPRVRDKINKPLNLLERQSSPQAPGSGLVENTGSETASVHTTHPDEHTASSGTTTDSSSEAGVDTDARPPAETSLPSPQIVASPDRTGREEDDFVSSRTENKRKASGSETDNTATKRATPTKTRSD